MREEALSARVNSCPSRNLRECEFFFCGGGEEHYRRGTTFSRAVMAALSFCHSEELQFRGICFAASPDREQGFPRRLPPARDDERRSSIGTSKLVPFPKSARMWVVFLRRRRGHYGKGTTLRWAVRAAIWFCHSEELQFRGICFAASPDREQGFPRRLPPARDVERRSSIGTSKLVPFPKSARM